MWSRHRQNSVLSASVYLLPNPETSLYFFSCETLNFFNKKVKAIFLPGASGDCCPCRWLSLMEENFSLLQVKLVWNLVYSEDPQLRRRKMTNGALEQFREHVSFSLRIVIWKFLLLTGSETWLLWWTLLCQVHFSDMYVQIIFELRRVVYNFITLPVFLINRNKFCLLLCVAHIFCLTCCSSLTVTCSCGPIIPSFTAKSIFWLTVIWVPFSVAPCSGFIVMSGTNAFFAFIFLNFSHLAHICSG